MRVASLSGLPNSPYVELDKKILHNHYITTVFGEQLDFRDIGVSELITIESQVETYGALLLVDEEAGYRLELGRASSADVVDNEQVEIIEELSELDAGKNFIPSRLIDRSLVAMRVMYASRIAVVTGSILIDAASMQRERLEELIQLEGQTAQPSTDGSGELYDRAQALSLMSLSPAAFIIKTAQHVHKAHHQHVSSSSSQGV